MQRFSFKVNVEFDTEEHIKKSEVLKEVDVVYATLRERFDCTQTISSMKRITVLTKVPEV